MRADLKAKKVTPIIPWSEWEACARKVRQVTDLGEAVKDADLVIEAVPENLETQEEGLEGDRRKSGARRHPRHQQFLHAGVAVRRSERPTRSGA